MDGSTPSATATVAVSASPLLNVQFRWLLASNLFFFMAMGAQGVVRSWLAFQLTGSKLALGQIGAAVAVPMLLVAPFGGVIADRVERRRLIHCGQAALVVSELVILALLWTGRLKFVHLLCGTVVMGVAFPMIMPARQAIVINLVGREGLTAAMAITAGTMSATRVLGPLISGLLIDAVGVRNAYAVGASLYVMAMLSLLGVSRSRAPLRTDPPSVMAHMGEGWRYLVSNRLLLILLVFGLVPMFLAMPVQQLMVVFAQEVWRTGSRGFGVLQATAGVAGVLGAIWVARLRTTKRLRAMFVTALAFPILLALFATTPWFWVAVALAFVGYGCSAVFNTLNNAAIQLLIPDHVRGRVSSFMLMSFSLPLLGTLPMGALADVLGAPMAVASACTACVLAVLGFYLASPLLRSLDARIDGAMSELAPPRLPS
jgi:MFS family permease